MAESPYEATFEALHSSDSLAHGYGMFPAYFLSAYVLGVRLDSPAQKRSVLIEPRLGDLTEASGTVGTEFGPVSVSWKQEGDQWNYKIDTSKLPDGTTARLRLAVGAGKFSAKLDDVLLKTGANGVKHQGRWLDVLLTLREHRGFWMNGGD